MCFAYGFYAISLLYREGIVLSIVAEYRVNFFDTDAMKVVHHANYIRWFEIGRVEYLRNLGITLDDMMADGFVFPITEVKAKYVSPGYFDDVLCIETRATALTKVKMAFDYRVYRKSDGTTLVTGHTQNVFTSRESGQIVRLPAKYHERLQKAMEQERAEKKQEQ
ncbi:MAG: acyl-CoA thioesterase [Selenomonadaceae bacterium]|nr:acyl-CoA thioesterase [Selenomonadaceae bacterium]MBR6906053.1 acyl-CoA thioesterase [Selenomonadaceae bacterium]